MTCEFSAVMFADRNGDSALGNCYCLLPLWPSESSVWRPDHFEPCPRVICIDCIAAGSRRALSAFPSARSCHEDSFYPTIRVRGSSVWRPDHGALPSERSGHAAPKQRLPDPFLHFSSSTLHIEDSFYHRSELRCLQALFHGILPRTF